MGTTKLALNSKWSGIIPVPNQPRPDAQPKPAPQFAQTYEYDSIGNRTQFLTESGGEKTDVLYESNALNQYTKLKRTEQDPENPTHDPDGNLLDDHRNHYTWNAENRCVKVEAKDGSYTVENAYDYQGRKTIRRHSTQTGVKTTIYLYDGWNVLAEIEQEQEREAPYLQSKASSLKPANSVRTYTWGRDLSGTLQGVGGVGGQLAITKKGQNLEDSVMCPCYDANGNICQMISPKAEILAAYQYDAFGRTLDLAGSKAAENPWRFSTKPLDFVTDWYYYGYRGYDPETGRWTSRDPIQEEGGVNLYGFATNDGIGSYDYLGWTTIRDIKFKIIVGPHIGAPGSTGYATVAPGDTKAVFDKIIQDAKEEWYQEHDMDVPCTWNNWEYVGSTNASPMGLTRLQNELSDNSVGLFFLLFHGYMHRGGASGETGLVLFDRFMDAQNPVRGAIGKTYSTNEIFTSSILNDKQAADALNKVACCYNKSISKVIRTDNNTAAVTPVAGTSNHINWFVSPVKGPTAQVREFMDFVKKACCAKEGTP